MKEFESVPVYQIILPASPAIDINFLLKQAQQQNQELKTKEETLYYLKYKVSNKLQPNGRINLGYDEKGQCLANSISPLADFFESNIEEGIKPVVLALKNKRYLTYSSCEGHDAWGRRYVGVAFDCKENADLFINKVAPLFKIGVTVRTYETVSNNNFQISKNKNVSCARLTPQDQDIYSGMKEEEIHNFNIQFKRNYSSYYFVEFIILDYFKPVILKNYWFNFCLWFKKNFMWDKITHKVTLFLNNDQFPKYKM